MEPSTRLGQRFIWLNILGYLSGCRSVLETSDSHLLMYCEGGSFEPLAGIYQVIDVSCLLVAVFDVDSNIIL